MKRSGLTLHSTDLKILTAFYALSARPGRITDRRMAEESGVVPKTVKNRRRRMAQRGQWPGRPLGRSKVKLSPEIEQFILGRSVAASRPTYEVIALEVTARFGRQIDPKAVGNVINRPAVRWLKVVQRRVQAEGLREYRLRHDPAPYRGEPAWQILRKLSAAQGRVLGLSPPGANGSEAADEMAESDQSSVTDYLDSVFSSVPSTGDRLPFGGENDLLSCARVSAELSSNRRLSAAIREGSSPC